MKSVNLSLIATDFLVISTTADRVDSHSIHTYYTVSALFACVSIDIDGAAKHLFVFLLEFGSGRSL